MLESLVPKVTIRTDERFYLPRTSLIGIFVENSTMQIEVAFPVTGELIPTDHAYLLYSALTRCVHTFHDAKGHVRFAPINGDRGEKGKIRIMSRSRLRVRLPAEQISVILPLAGRILEIGEHSIILRPPVVVPIVPTSILLAKIVTFKNSKTPERFLAVARQRLDEIDVAGEPGIPLIQGGKRVGEPRRQILRVKGRKIVGYPLQITGLTADESLRLQEEGLGGRRRIGCGFFIPYPPRT
jgi:CRISPR-associated protein Cas6